MHLLTSWLIAVGGGMMALRMLKASGAARTAPRRLAFPRKDTGRPSPPRDRPNPVASVPRYRTPVAPDMAVPARAPSATDPCAAMMAAMTGPGLCTPTVRAPLSQPQE